ncbi:hypothetical protein KBZ21_46130, partial [Streptomyces sp. A73]|nr:hypothetical protein [Streptomyces sp. A73]
RWIVEWHQRAIHITRLPTPNCPQCGGSGGGWIPTRLGADWDEGPCLDAIHTWRIPLAPRKRHETEGAPF